MLTPITTLPARTSRRARKAELIPAIVEPECATRTRLVSAETKEQAMKVLCAAGERLKEQTVEEVLVTKSGITVIVPDRKRAMRNIVKALAP